jgi:hypothetical protein
VYLIRASGGIRDKAFVRERLRFGTGQFSPYAEERKRNSNSSSGVFSKNVGPSLVGGYHCFIGTRTRVDHRYISNTR